MRLSIENQTQIAAWVAGKVGSERFLEDFKAIGAFDGDKLCGAVVYDRFSGNDCDLTIAIEDKKCVTRRTVHAIFAYPFEQLGLHRVTAQVCVENEASLCFIQRLGFKFEGCKREAMNGKDLLIYGLIRRNCRWIHG